MCIICVLLLLLSLDSYEDNVAHLCSTSMLDSTDEGACIGLGIDVDADMVSIGISYMYVYCVLLLLLSLDSYEDNAAHCSLSDSAEGICLHVQLNLSSSKH